MLVYLVYKVFIAIKIVFYSQIEILIGQSTCLCSVNVFPIYVVVVLDLMSICLCVRIW